MSRAASGNPFGNGIALLVVEVPQRRISAKLFDRPSEVQLLLIVKSLSLATVVHLLRSINCDDR